MSTVQPSNSQTVCHDLVSDKYVLWLHVILIYLENQSDYEHRLRSSRPELFCKKGDLKNFTKFTGKNLCQSLFFNNVAGLGLQLS